jgi:hypothetical protein
MRPLELPLACELLRPPLLRCVISSALLMRVLRVELGEVGGERPGDVVGNVDDERPGGEFGEVDSGSERGELLLLLLLLLRFDVGPAELI